jgi:glycosyltransferase involved in cell wall biosynthesis
MRKKRILFCSEATFLNTGYATYTREILNYLHHTNKYDIAELGAYGNINDQREINIPWTYFGAMLPENSSQQEKQTFHSKFSNQFGEYYFHDVCLKFKPDIVCDIRDFWMLEFQERSPYRPFYKWCIMPTVDAFPQARQWIATYQSADACLSYSNWAGEVLKHQSNNNINYIGAAPPSAHPAYGLIQDKTESRKSIGLDEDKKIIGTVMRNQRRKLYPDLFETFRILLDSVEDPNNYILYCHTSFPDMGWDIPELLQKYGLSSHVMFTYICTKTKRPFASFFNGPRCISPFTKELDAIMVNVKVGLSYEELSNIMNCFDLYVQYANSEGFGLPQVEAAACSVPVASVNYSAMESVIEQLEGIPLDVKALYKEMETGCMRAVPDNIANAKKIFDFFQKPSFERKKVGFNTKQNFLKHFQWSKSGSVWESYFDSVEIVDESLTWYSKPRIKMPAKCPPVQQFNSIDEMSEFLIDNVLCKPEKKNTFFHAKLSRDLLYGYTSHGSAGIYSNDSSSVDEIHSKKTNFNLETAYRYMVELRMEENRLEQMRAEAFNLK